MILYQYHAKDRAGQEQTGIVEADSEAEAAEILHKKDFTVVSITPAKSMGLFMGARTQKVKPDDLVIFVRQLSTMIDAGIPLVNALGILTEQIENKQLKSVVTAVRQDIDAGMGFSDALSKHPKVFSGLFINMSRAGEASGQLNEVLDRLATYLEKSSALSRKIRSSLIYPAVVVSMAAVITFVLLVKVVPTFKNIFDILGGELPLPTQILILVSDLLRKYFLAVAGLAVIFVFLLKRYIDTEKGRFQFDKNKLKVPVLGGLFHKLAIAKFARTFSTLARSGIPVLQALEIVSKTSGNKLVEKAVLDCAQSVREGESICRPLGKSGVFPPMVCRMISVGEQAGELEKMLGKIADFYEEQVDAAASALASMIEPLVIGFLGVVIGGIVVALFLPIFKLTQLMAR